MSFKRCSLLRYRLFCGSAFALTALVGAAQASCAIGANDVTVSRDLGFGAIVSGPSGSVTVTPAGSRTSAGGAVVLNSTQFPAASPAEFQVCSADTGTVYVLLPSSIELSRPGGGAMTVDAFTSSPEESLGVSVSSSGRAVLALGARLNIAASQAPGIYTGSFSVTITYQ